MLVGYIIEIIIVGTYRNNIKTCGFQIIVI